jgi:hypothetical protein
MRPLQTKAMPGCSCLHIKSERSRASDERDLSQSQVQKFIIALYPIFHQENIQK